MIIQGQDHDRWKRNIMKSAGESFLSLVILDHDLCFCHNFHFKIFARWKTVDVVDELVTMERSLDLVSR